MNSPNCGDGSVYGRAGWDVHWRRSLCCSSRAGRHRRLDSHAPGKITVGSQGRTAGDERANTRPSLEAAERVRCEALGGGAERKWEQREKSRQAAELAYKHTLERIERLVQDFGQIEGTERATVVFDELRRILADEGVDAALAYLDRHRGDALARAKQRKKRLAPN